MLNRFLKSKKQNAKSQTPKARKLRMEYLENRELLSVTPTEAEAVLAQEALLAEAIAVKMPPTIDLSSLNALSSEIAEATVASTSTLTVTTNLSGLAANTTYYFRAKSVGVGVYVDSDWSETVSATTLGFDTPSTVVTTKLDVVDPEDGVISLREAIQYAEADSTLGSTITFAPSLKGATITLNGTQLNISKGVAVDASALYDEENNVPGITVNANDKSRVFNVSGGTEETPVAFVGLTITGGKGPGDGGGVYTQGATTFTDCAITDCVAAYGGGVFVKGKATFTNSSISGNSTVQAFAYGGGVFVDWYSEAIFADCLINDNTSHYGGGVFASGNTATFTNTTISGNEASNGGGVWLKGTATFENCLISDNEASDGGVFVRDQATTTVVNATISSNVGRRYGGGVGGEEFTSTFAGCLISDNTAASGGGVWASGSTTFTNSTISGNKARHVSGGGVCLKGTATFENTTIVGNSLESCTALGGGVYVSGTATFTNATISDNNVSAEVVCNELGGDLSEIRGGGVYVSGTATFTNATISRNNVVAKVSYSGEYEISWENNLESPYNVYGGGVCVDGKATFTNAIISDNNVTAQESFERQIYDDEFYDGYAVFGGVYVKGTTTFANAVVAGNRATSKYETVYAGIYVDDNSTASLTNSTATGNSATSKYGDAYGGIYVKSGATAILKNSIVALNEGAQGGDVAGDYGTKKAQNTLSSFTDWSNANESGVANYVYDASQPLFTDAANGDYTLAAGSQALDKGNDAYAVDAEGNPLTTDLAGRSRFFNGTVDLGAYERCGAAPETIETIADVLAAFGETVEIDLSQYFSEGDWTYSVKLSSELSDALAAEPTVDGNTLTLKFLAKDDYALDLNLSDVELVVVASTADGASVDSNAFKVGLTDRYSARLTAVLTTMNTDDAYDVYAQGRGKRERYGADETPVSDAPATPAEPISLQIWAEDFSHAHGLTLESNVGFTFILKLENAVLDQEGIYGDDGFYCDYFDAMFGKIFTSADAGYKNLGDNGYWISIGYDFLSKAHGVAFASTLLASLPLIPTGEGPVSATLEASADDTLVYRRFDGAEYGVDTSQVDLGGASTSVAQAVSGADVVSEAFADFFAEEDAEDDFWFEFEKALGKRVK